jgi:hypothetical protein
MKYDWNSINWNLSTFTICGLIGANAEYVEKKRAELAPHTSTRKKDRVIDWNKPDDEIAAEIGVKKESVYIMRKRKGEPNLLAVYLPRHVWVDVIDKIDLLKQDKKTVKIIRAITNALRYQAE